MYDIDQQGESITPWFMDFNTVMGVWFVSGIICGVICALIARENERAVFPALVAGFFLGALGIVAYMIMGETVELRTYKAEKEKLKIAKELKLKE